MNSAQEQIRDQQKETWDRFSPGWKKWDDFVMTFLGPMGKAIIDELHVQPTDHVLDVASGTGEPGLTIAGIASHGKVIGTDLSEGMLQVAKEKAEARGIGNFSTMACDAGELPFHDATFDAVSCRFGFMFFPDMAQASREMVRVLKPGGRLATTVWAGPELNPWTTLLMGPIKKHLDLPDPPPGSPGIFRCAEDDFMVQLFRDAGLREVNGRTLQVTTEVPSHQFYWDHMNEIAAPIVAAMSKADEATRERIRQEVRTAQFARYPNEPAHYESAALVISGIK